MKNTKAQAALEFLTTYGWAIMVVMVAIGALSYFGVLNPSKPLPERCVFGNGFTCDDWQVTETMVNFTLKNGLGTTLYSVSASNESFGGSCGVDTATVSADGTLKVGCSILSTSKPTFGDKAKFKIKLTFKKIQTTGYNQVSFGEVYATVQ